MDSVMLSQASEAALSNQHVNVSSTNMTRLGFLKPTMVSHSENCFMKLLCQLVYVQANLILLLSSYCIFYELKVCGNRTSSNSIGAIFLTAFVYFMSVCRILLILPLFQTFSLLYFSKYYITLCSITLHYIIYYSNQ